MLPDVLDHLHSVRRVSNGYMALCPAHPDRNPSLSITERDGKVLLHCHAGCSLDSVLSAAGIEKRELFADAKPELRITASYEYTDEDGRLLFQVLRYEPKQFRQRRPDGRGGWLWNLAGVRRVLYHLPEVLKAESVLILEGEKDCETARSLGLVGTCNPGGAGKWQPAYSECLRGKDVAIICDADAPGLEHGWRVARSLNGIAGSIRMIERLPDGKDFSEWAERGGARDAWFDIIRKTPELKPEDLTKRETNQTTNGFTLTPLGELMARPDEPAEYVWDGVLVAGTVSLLVAKPKVGKSTLARNLCLAVARGSDFLGHPTRQGECIYLALEEREEDIRADFAAMGAEGSEPILIHAAAAPAEGIRALCDLIRERKPRLVEIDPLFRLARIRDEKAYAEVYHELGPLIDAAREAGTHVLLSHHGGKAAKADPIDSPLGSTALGGAVSTLIVLKRTEGYRTIQTVQRIGRDLPETVLQFDPETRRLSIGGTRFDAEVLAISEEILKFLDGTPDRKTEPEITEAVEGKTKLIREAIRKLVEQGKVAREGGGKKGDPYTYTKCLFFCSQYIPGTREQESQNRPLPRENTMEKLVPAFGRKSFLVPDVGTAAKRPVSSVESRADALEI